MPAVTAATASAAAAAAVVAAAKAATKAAVAKATTKADGLRQYVLVAGQCVRQEAPSLLVVVQRQRRLHLRWLGGAGQQALLRQQALPPQRAPHPRRRRAPYGCARVQAPRARPRLFPLPWRVPAWS
eukprot:COSAG01_NODE_3651_length_5823_cov_43.348821_8_plen_127_part_00